MYFHGLGVEKNIKEAVKYENLTLDFSIQEEKKQELVERNEPVYRIKEMTPRGIVYLTYIIAENEDGMYVIDQHAAAERINYEKVLNSLKESHTIVDLLIPIKIELTTPEFLIVKENFDLIKSYGFEIEEFGLNTIVIKSHPTWLLTGYEKESIEKLVDLLINDYNIDRIKFHESIAKTLACKMSVKGNTRINSEQMQKLIDNLVLCDNPYNCPHGRPTIIKFTKYELEKMFKRVMN